MTKSVKIVSLALVIISVSFGLAWIIQDISRSASTDLSQLTGHDFERRYMTDLLSHYQGALDMTDLAAKQSTNQDILNLAQTMAQEQLNQQRQLKQWQLDWGYPTDDPAAVMTDHMHHFSNQLQGATGQDFDRQFLRQMIEHHQMAVDMSGYAIDRATHQSLKDLAQHIITTQTAEIEQMEKLLSRLDQPAAS